MVPVKIDPLSPSKIDPLNPPVRRKRIGRRCKICIVSTLIVSALLGIAAAIVTSLYVDLVEEGQGAPIPLNLSRVADAGELSRFAHYNDSEVSNVFTNADAPTSDREEVAPHVVDGGYVRNPDNNGGIGDMDIVEVERRDDGTFVEHGLHFDAAARAYLNSHPEALRGGANDSDASTPPPARRRLGPHGADSRVEVTKAQALATPHSSVVRLRTSGSWGPGTAFCTGTLVDDDTVLTAAHCVYRNNAYRFPEVEVHPWMVAHSPFRPGTWGSSHADCANRLSITYPCIRWCRGWWGIWYPCGVRWCTRYWSEPTDCTWRYTTRSVIVPNAWKTTACQGNPAGSCPESEFQHDIALIKLNSAQGRHAGDPTRASVKTPVHTDTYSGNYAITGYPGDRSPFLATASGPIDLRNSNILRHTIDANSGQSGSGVSQGNNVYGVHVYGGPTTDGARRIDLWWLHILVSQF